MKEKQRYHKFPYDWRIADGYPAKGIEHHGCKVFGTFICGGGSSMGYKLAGYDHLGGVEIDQKVAEIYRTNHHPKHLFVQDLREFNERTDIPDELFGIDLLDGSPPCSAFSMAGSREDAWGKEKQFAEGQKLQTLDDLVFVYCETIMKLKPKVFLLENVKGLTVGNAKSYLKRIVGKLADAGYVCQVFVLNSASMGVPQRRERAFVIGHRSEYDVPRLKLEFNEVPIKFREVIDKSDMECNLSKDTLELWNQRIPSDKTLSDINKRVMNKNGRFNEALVSMNDVCSTLTTKCDAKYLYDIPRKINTNEIIRVSSFPTDYAFPSQNVLRFLTGMSVPPVMTAQIAHQIWLQWLSKIVNK